MRITPEISYRGIRKTDALESLINSKISKLERFYHPISSCRVSIEKVHDHPNGGSPYKVRLDIMVPESREIVVNKSPDDGVKGTPLNALVRDAFAIANRRLKEMNELQHNHMKTHVPGKREVALDKAVYEPNVPPADATGR